MSEPIRLVESRPAECYLTQEQAQAITTMGKALASKMTWWGSSPADASDDARTAITCVPSGATRWNVTVSNAIGAFGVGELTFIVLPKIPASHILYMLSRATLLPRMHESPVYLSLGADLWELIARWFVEHTASVISRDLIRDYQNSYAPVSSVRGQIDAIASARQYYSGSLNFICSHDDFTIDNSHNRVLLGGLTVLQGLTHLQSGIRKESRRLSSYFFEVGPLRQWDFDLTTDRRTAHYADALSLARLIISSTALSISDGLTKVWTFLIRTPEAVEAGIRSILREGLSPDFDVRKYGTALVPSNMQIVPDLRFDPYPAVGDVKYKTFGAEWPRVDLYQSVAFAAASRARVSCVISFSSQGVMNLPTVRFRDIDVSHITWNAGATVDPVQAAQRLVMECKEWLTRELPMVSSL